jgi:uncharacterized membrane protein
MTDLNKSMGESSLGMPPNLAGLLCYFLGFITGAVFFILERKNRFVRFHALQSTILFGGIFVVNTLLLAIPVVGVIINLILSLMSLVLWVLLMIKAYQGEIFKLPVIGDIAEKRA